MPDNPRDSATPNSSDSHNLDWMNWRPGSASQGCASQGTVPQGIEGLPHQSTESPDPGATPAPSTISLTKTPTETAAAATLPQVSPTPGSPPPPPTTSGWEVTQSAELPPHAQLYTPPTRQPPPATPVTPYRSPYPSSHQSGGRRQSKSSWLIGVGLAVVVALILGGAVWAATEGPLKSNKSSTSATGGDVQNLPDTLTACSQPLNISAPQTTLTSAGLNVTFTASSPCSDGDVLSGSQVDVMISSSAGPIADGVFDLSSSPIGVPPQPGSRQITLTYPPGSFYQLPDASSGSAVTVQVTDSGAAGTPTLSSSQASGAASATASQAITPTGVNVDDVAAQSLRTQSDTDRTKILSGGNNQWVAQLSSKQPGLVADGKTWTNKDILDEFASNYQRFSGARLLWSDEWSVFSSPGWWVTITAQTFPSPQAAVSWCQQQNFDRDHCLGKLISNTAPPEGSTVYIR